MGRALRFLAPGVLGASLLVAVVAAYKLWADIDRDLVGKPTPIHNRRVIPIHDGTYG